MLLCQGQFRARILISVLDGIIDKEVWDDELTPLLKTGKRSIRKWAEEHLDNWSVEDYQDRFEIPVDWHCIELVFSASIRGLHNSHTDEYDEEIEIVVEPKMQQLPNTFFEDHGYYDHSGVDDVKANQTAE